jgi:hypothetical protein
VFSVRFVMCQPEHDQELVLLLSKYEVPSTGPSYTHTHTHTHPRANIRIYVCMCVSTHTHTYTHTRTHTHTQVRTHHSPINPGDRQQHQRQHQHHLSERPPRSTQHPTALVCIFYSFFFALLVPHALVSVQILKSTLYIYFYLIFFVGWSQYKFSKVLYILTFT